MAHVAISRDFIARVETKISKMRQAEINALGKEPELSVSPDSPVIINAVWKDHAHLRDVIPVKWKDTTGNLRLTFNTTTTQETINTDGTTEVSPVSCQFTVSAPTDQRFDLPPNDYWHSIHMVKAEDVSHPDIRKAVEFGNAKAEIEMRWSQVTRKVVQFFQSCKSMKEAVTLWPECKMYIDSDDIERFEKKVVKTASQDSEAAKVLAGINTDELVGAAVAARFSGAA
jgi:hypothetical protein